MWKVLERIAELWERRLASILGASAHLDKAKPGTGEAYKEGYYRGYWDGVADTLSEDEPEVTLAV